MCHSPETLDYVYSESIIWLLFFESLGDELTGALLTSDGQACLTSLFSYCNFFWRAVALFVYVGEQFFDRFILRMIDSFSSLVIYFLWEISVKFLGREKKIISKSTAFASLRNCPINCWTIIAIIRIYDLIVQPIWD